MKMKTMVVTEHEGSFQELLARAVTGSIIELGNFTGDHLRGTLQGLYYEGDEEEILLIDNFGSTHSFGKHVCDEWEVGPKGMIVIVRIGRGCEFFEVHSDGTETSLGRHLNREWYVGQYDVYNGLIIKKWEEVFCVNSDGVKTKLGTFDPNKWDKMRAGIVDISCIETIDGEMEPMVGYKYTARNGAVTSLGFYDGNETLDCEMGPNGLYIRTGNRLLLAVIKP